MKKLIAFTLGMGLTAIMLLLYFIVVLINQVCQM